MTRKTKTPSQCRKGARTSHGRWLVKHEIPFSKGGRRRFRRNPQVAGREDFSLVGWYDSESG